MEITVRIVKFLDTQSGVSQRTGEIWEKHYFIGETQGQYPKKVCFSVFGKEAFAGMGLVEGVTYAISFDVESREWQGKWFTELKAWKATAINGAQGSAGGQSPQPATASAAAQAQRPAAARQAAPENGGENANDDVPF